MTFEPGKVYSHPGLRDTQIFIRAQPEVTGNGVRLKVTWLTKRFGVMAEDEIEVSTEGSKDWSEVSKQ